MKILKNKLKNQFGVTLVEVLIVMGIMGGLAVVMMNMTKQQNVMQKKAESSFEVSTVHTTIVSTLLTAKACTDTLRPAGNIKTATGISAIRNRQNAVIFNTTTNYNNLVRIPTMRLKDLILTPLIVPPGGRGFGEITLEMTYEKTASILPGEAKTTRFDILLKVEVNDLYVVTNCYSATENAIDESKLQSCAALNGTFNTTTQKCILSSYTPPAPPVANPSTAVSTQYLMDFLNSYLDLRYVNVTGDTMTGALVMNAAPINVNNQRVIISNGGITTTGGSNAFTNTTSTYVNSGISLTNSTINSSNGNITLTGGYIYTDQYVSVSDKRLKKDFSSLEGTSSKIYDLKTYEFFWRRDNRKDYGFIAQEVEELFPELVIKNKKSGYKGVQYVSLIPLIIEEMKKLKNENEELRLENEELRKDVQEIKAYLKLKEN